MTETRGVEGWQGRFLEARCPLFDGETLSSNGTPVIGKGTP